MEEEEEGNHIKCVRAPLLRLGLLSEGGGAHGERLVGDDLVAHHLRQQVHDLRLKCVSD